MQSKTPCRSCAESKVGQQDQAMMSVPDGRPGGLIVAALVCPRCDRADEVASLPT